MKFPKEILTLKARIEASEATEKIVFKVLKEYIEEAQSYGDELEIDTFYESFSLYYKKRKRSLT